MLLDNRTLLFSLMLVSVMMALSLAAVSWGREHEGMKKWAGALLLEAIAWLLFSARTLIPDIFSIAAAALMIVAAQSLSWRRSMSTAGWTGRARSACCRSVLPRCC